MSFVDMNNNNVTWELAWVGQAWLRVGCEVSEDKYSFSSCGQMKMHSFSFFKLCLLFIRFYKVEFTISSHLHLGKLLFILQKLTCRLLLPTFTQPHNVTSFPSLYGEKGIPWHYGHLFMTLPLSELCSNTQLRAWYTVSTQ